jgi:hypothetical protein
MKIILFLFICFSLGSETIILKNGQSIQGKVLGHDSESITISINGETKSVPKNQVHKVVFSSNHIEVKKIIQDKKKNTSKTEDKMDEEENSKEEDFSDDRKNISEKLEILRLSQERYEKKLARIRLKIQKLKQKLKNKKVTS